MNTDFDLVVIGGGINGAGIARDAAGRGVSVMLCEKGDLAEHTSSASTKLIHGGLRYLEHYDFALVRHALKEREVLLKAAPHIVWPLRFILPHHKSLRPRWLIRLGLFLYDHLGGRKLLPKSQSVDLSKHVSGTALKHMFTHAFEYSDCWVQDARLVVLNVMDAAERGCDVRVRTEVTNIERNKGFWIVELHDNNTGQSSSVTAKAIANASGPWVERTLDLDEEHKARLSTRLVKGSHIVVPKIFEHPYAYIFQNADDRILFAIPFENDYTLLGTTDLEIEDELGPMNAAKSEIDYICDAVNEYFSMQIRPEDVVWSFSGVRPLYDDASSNASKVTRDYKLDLDSRNDAPVLSVYGGKITTYRKLAEHAVDMLSEHLGINQQVWTATAALPGGNIPDADFDSFLLLVANQYPWLDQAMLEDYARNYGTRIDKILTDKRSEADLGEHFGGLLFQAEVDYLIAHEYAQQVDDVVWRRSKKGLGLTPAQMQRVSEYLETKRAEVSG